MADLPCRLIARVHRTAVNDSDSQLNVAAALMQPVVRRGLFPELPPCFRLRLVFKLCIASCATWTPRITH